MESDSFISNLLYSIISPYSRAGNEETLDPADDFSVASTTQISFEGLSFTTPLISVKMTSYFVDSNPILHILVHGAQIAVVQRLLRYAEKFTTNSIVAWKDISPQIRVGPNSTLIEGT